MTNGLSLSNRLRELFLDGQWIANTNYQHQLGQVHMEIATQRVSTLNSIAALTYHIDYYLVGLLQVLHGGTLDISDRYSFDLPPISSEADWEALRERMIRHARSFIDAVAAMGEDRLDAPFVKAEYGTYRRNIEAVVEHGYYHLGQIVLLRRMLASAQS